jgi:triosephosphate isomerase (TIM)
MGVFKGSIMRKMVIANWKMNGDQSLAKALTTALKLQSYHLDIKLVLCPPTVLLPFVEGKLKHNPDIALGAQDVSRHEVGAFTGEVSARMLKEAGCQYVIIGHSECRTYHHETTEIILEKMKQALNVGLIPVVCIGESLADREANRTETVLSAQLDPILKQHQSGFVLAYEPIWAIGTGVTASIEQIQQTHAFLQKKLYNCADLPLLYGGSVNAANADSILSLKDVNGVLVGGASLKVNEITEICRAAHEPA